MAGKNASGSGKKTSPVQYAKRTPQPNDPKGMRRADYSSQRPYLVPQVRYTRGTDTSGPVLPAETEKGKPIIYKGVDLVKLEPWGNPVVLYGQPFSGKSSLFYNLHNVARDHFGSNHWIRMVEFRHLASIVKTCTKRPKSILQLLALHLKVPEKTLRDLFKPDPNADSKKFLKGDLFLDGFDEISAKERDYFWKIIPQLRSKWGVCSVRVWISCRSYLKSRMSSVFTELGHFDILKYSNQQQLDLLYHHWKNDYFPKLDKEKLGRLWVFTQAVISQLNWIVPDFENTIGCIPVFIEVVASLFSHHLKIALTCEQHYYSHMKAAVCITDVMDSFAGSLIECYCLKISRAKMSKYDPRLADQEYPKVARLYGEFALQTYPTYKYGGTAAQRQNANDSKVSTSTSTGGVINANCKQTVRSISEDLHRIGFLVKDDDGCVRFHHKMFGDFFLGKYYAFKDSLDGGNIDFDRFYLRTVLFEQEGRGILSHYDAFVRYDLDYQPRLLHDFLIKHYKLGKDEEDEWEKIKDNGNVWHLAVLQGFHCTARLILNAFKLTEKAELRKFLIMRAPLDVMEENHVQMVNGRPQAVRNRHLVSSLSVLAMFGYGTFVDETLRTFVKVFGPQEIAKEFNRQGEWSPVHYAAIHSNLWFINQVYGTDFHLKVGIKPGIFCPRGYLPLHLLMTSAWYHVMRIKDCGLADYDLQVPAKKGAPSGSKSNQKTKKTSPKKKDGGSEGGGDVGKVENFEGGDADDYRMLVRDRYLRKDWHTVHGLMATLNGCINRLVVNGGEDVNAFDKEEVMTLFHRVAQEGLLETSRLVVNLGGDLNLQNVDGMTPVHLAAMYGFKDVFKALVKVGGKVTIQDGKGNSPIMAWKEWGESFYFARKEPALSRDDKYFIKCCSDLDQLTNDKNSESEDKTEEVKEKMKRLEAELHPLAYTQYLEEHIDEMYQEELEYMRTVETEDEEDSDGEDDGESPSPPEDLKDEREGGEEREGDDDQEGEDSDEDVDVENNTSEEEGLEE